jgi:hypothetical protein
MGMFGDDELPAGYGSPTIAGGAGMGIEGAIPEGYGTKGGGRASVGAMGSVLDRGNQGFPVPGRPVAAANIPPSQWTKPGTQQGQWGPSLTKDIQNPRSPYYSQPGRGAYGAASVPTGSWSGTGNFKYTMLPDASVRIDAPAEHAGKIVKPSTVVGGAYMKILEERALIPGAAGSTTATKITPAQIATSLSSLATSLIQAGQSGQRPQFQLSTASQPVYAPPPPPPPPPESAGPLGVPVWAWGIGTVVTVAGLGGLAYLLLSSGRVKNPFASRKNPHEDEGDDLVEED